METDFFLNRYYLMILETYPKVACCYKRAITIISLVIFIKMVFCDIVARVPVFKGLHIISPKSYQLCGAAIPNNHCSVRSKCTDAVHKFTQS